MSTSMQEENDNLRHATRNGGEPVYLGEAFGPESCAMFLPDGTLRYFYTDKSVSPSIIYSRASNDGGDTWGEQTKEFVTPPVRFPHPDSPLMDTRTWYSLAAAVDDEGEIHILFQVLYGEGGRANLAVTWRHIG